MRSDVESVRLGVTLLEHDSQPEWLEPPYTTVPVRTDAFDGKRVAGQAEDLAAPSPVVGDAEGDVDESDVEPEKTGDRPSADRHESYANPEADQPQPKH